MIPDRPLEQALCDFAVIRTTFDTLDYFPDDEKMRAELDEMIQEAREKLVARLAEIVDMGGQFHGGDTTNLAEFQSMVIALMERGIPGGPTNRMMRLDAYDDMAIFQYRFRDGMTPDEARRIAPRLFPRRVFVDLLAEAEDESNYTSRGRFNERVFQKYIAVMWCNYATTDPLFLR